MKNDMKSLVSVDFGASYSLSTGPAIAIPNNIREPSFRDEGRNTIPQKLPWAKGHSQPQLVVDCGQRTNVSQIDGRNLMAARPTPCLADWNDGSFMLVGVHVGTRGWICISAKTPASGG